MAFNPKPVRYTLDLMEELFRHGDIDVVKTIDFSQFQSNQIKEIENIMERIMNWINRDKPEIPIWQADGIRACSDYLDKVLITEFKWETQGFTIYAHCLSNICIHKIFDKTNQCFTTFYGNDIKKLLAQEKICLPHFA